MTTPDPAEAMLSVMESLAPVREALNGYRTQLIADGYSPTAAEMMTMELHKHILTSIFAGTKT